MDSSDDSQTSSNNFSSDNLGHVIAVLRPYIEERVTLHHLVPHMECMKNVYHIVFDCKDDRKKTADVFFNHLKEIRDPGKYQQLIFALEQGNWPIVVEAIRRGEIMSSDEENIRLIELFLSKIADAITPESMSQELIQKQLISAHEGEKICNLARNESSLDAALFLLIKIHCRKSTWYSDFLDILWDYDHKELVREIDDKFYSLKTEGAKASDSTEPNFDQALVNFSSDFLSSSSIADVPRLVDEHDNMGDSSQLKQPDTALAAVNEQSMIQAFQTILSDQISPLRDLITQVSDRLLVVERKVVVVERKVDNILEKLK